MKSRKRKNKKNNILKNNTSCEICSYIITYYNFLNKETVMHFGGEKNLDKCKKNILLDVEEIYDIDKYNIKDFRIENINNKKQKVTVPIEKKHCYIKGEEKMRNEEYYIYKIIKNIKYSSPKKIKVLAHPNYKHKRLFKFDYIKGERCTYTITALN